MITKHKNSYHKLMPILYAVLLSLFASGSYAKDIYGYDDLVSRYAGDLSEDEQTAFKASIQASVHSALDHILHTELSATQVERRHMFRQSKNRPTKLFEFNGQYTAIGFEKVLNYRGVWEKSAYVLLFEIKDLRHLKYMDSYLFWKGNSSVEAYKQISNNSLCRNFSLLTRMDQCNNSITQKIAGVEEQKPPPPPPQTVAKTESPLATTVDDLNLKLNHLSAAIEQKADKQHTHAGGDIISGIIPETFIDKAIARDRELMNSQREVSSQNIDDAYVATLENRVNELENTVKELTELLSGIYRDQDNLVFSGMNVQIINGTGNTGGTVNGTGNLIVGYNQAVNGNHTLEQTGSHNIVLGDGHTYTSYGSFVAGLSNTVSGSYSSVTGGLKNVASGDYSTVNGGHFKTAEGVYSVAVPDKAEAVEEKTEKKRGCFIGQLLR